VICRNCGTENEAGRKFCGECAAPLVAICPNCATPNPPTSKFCGECATPLVAGATARPLNGAADATPGAPTVPSATASQPVAERRVVSILFADLVGFTSLAEGRDAEDTRDLLSRYFDLSRDVIGRYGGTVEKFIGDAVMAVWGAPIAHEDDAERAVRAALELVDAIRTLGPGVAARAGVLTGEAAVTIGATNQGMVAGDIVNTAARLQSVAAPGTVLVGETTERAASRGIAFEPAGEQALKGKTAPVPAWRALRVIAQVGGRNRSETLEAPFVGRDDELRLIKDLFHATVRERRARLVSVIGAAGIGKTRLAWEFGKYRDGLVEAVWYHEGRSPAYGDGITFWALGEMVRRRAGLVETDDEETTRAKVAATVAEHVPNDGERRWIETALLALLGISTSQMASEDLFAAWRTFFERLAATGPVVMLFEDFHHADSGLIDFVDHLLEWSRAYPIYVVTLSRPDLLEKRSDWGAGKRSFTSIVLEPLPVGAMHDLLGGLVPGLPANAEDAIVARADGVPLYAVETVRMLLSEGRLTLEGGVYRPSGDLTTLAVPETLTALIASRLDALPAAERALVADAAVLGQSFTVAGLASVSGLDPDDLAARLRSLVGREIFMLQTDPRSPERGQYIFVQALIREVAYNALAKRDRKSRHLAAARFFESLGTDEVAGGLAGHYLAAYRNSAEGEEADAVAGQARIALTAAAQRASGLGSHAQAQMFLEQAMTVTTDPAETARLLQRAGEAALLGSRYEESEKLLRRAVEAQRALGDRPAIAAGTALLGRMLIDAYRTLDAIALLGPAVDEFGDLARSPEGVALAGQLARAYYLNDDNARAIELADRVLAVAEHEDMRAIVADTLVTKGTALGAIGRSVEGIGAIEAGRRLAEANGFGGTELRALNNLCYIGGIRAHPMAIESAREGLALARRLGVRGMIASMTQNIGEFSLRTGDWDDAVALLDQAMTEEWDPGDLAWLRIARTPYLALRGEPIDAEAAALADEVAGQTDIQVLSNYQTCLAWFALAHGDLAEARERNHRSEGLASAFAPIARPRAARASLWLGDAASAAEDLAVVASAGVHGPAIDADVRTLEAGVAALEGRTIEALGLYREALRTWRDIGLAWDEALCGVDMAILIGPSEPDVRAAAEASRQILARLRAQPILARLERALAADGPVRDSHAASSSKGEPARA
jgi:class 3 adenylate cyclase/tetratricopeptide (TPR) repeat protein